jgi:hypothetical protein
MKNYLIARKNPDWLTDRPSIEYMNGSKKFVESKDRAMHYELDEAMRISKDYNARMSYLHTYVLRDTDIKE